MTTGSLCCSLQAWLVWYKISVCYMEMCKSGIEIFWYRMELFVNTFILRQDCQNCDKNPTFDQLNRLHTLQNCSAIAVNIFLRQTSCAVGLSYSSYQITLFSYLEPCHIILQILRLFSNCPKFQILPYYDLIVGTMYAI